jgi:hypothetical protein
MSDRFLLARLASLAWLAAALFAQSYQGSLRGRVADASQSPLPGANVRLTDELTGVTRSTLTNDAGEYAFNFLTPSRYRLEATAPGFRPAEKRGVIIETQSAVRLDLSLSVGELEQRIEVAGQVALVETSQASQGQVVEQQRLIDLPNQGRNVYIMAARLTPNVMSVANPRFLRMLDQTGASRISIAGGPILTNNFLLDGVPITDSTNRVSLIPSIEAVQETKIQYNTYDAEIGRTGGGIFNTVLRSGSNLYHGSAFGYLRETALFANDFFRNRAGQERPQTPYRNWGGSFGGPAWFPRLYNGRNRTFFWLAQESFRQKENFTNSFAVPTEAERAGDFSLSRNRVGQLQTIFDPLTSRVNADGAVIRQAFPNNILPASRIDPVGRAVAAYFPKSATTPRYFGDLNLVDSSVVTNQGDQYIGKVDHDLFRWFRLSLSAAHYQSEEPGPYHFSTLVSPGQNVLLRYVDATQFNATLTPSATTVVNLRYGYNRFPNERVNVSEGFDPAQLGFAAAFTRDIQNRRFPRFGMQQMTGLGSNTGQVQFFNSKNALANVARVAGRHNYKAGFAYRKVNVDFAFTGNSSGTFNFTNAFTRRDPRVADNDTGADLAALLLGYPASGSADTTTKLFEFIHYYAGYVHDDWRVSSRLTLNLGLRYEYETGLAERENRFIVGFDRQARNPIGAAAGVDTRGVLLYAGEGGNPTACCSPSKTNFSPRVGAAYSFNPSTVLRGGYGIFFAPPLHEGFNTLGYNRSTPLVGSFDGDLTPAARLQNPFPNGLLKPVGNSEGPLSGVGQNIQFLDQETGSLRVQQFSLDIQRELPGNLAVMLGYVGSRSSRVHVGMGAININQLEPRHLPLGAQLLQQVDNPFFGKGGTGVIAAPRVTRAQLLRPFPQFGAVNLLMSDDNTAKYDSLVLRAQKRFSGNASFITTYTWSKNMDGSFGASNQIASQPGGLQNAYDRKAEYGLSTADVTHRFTSGVSLALPFGRGQRWLNGSRLLDLAVGGWQGHVVTVIQSGFPLAVVQAVNLNAAIGASLQRPNATGQSPKTPGSVQERLDRYLNPAAFTTAAQFTFGNTSRLLNVRGPGLHNWDLALFKSFTLYERLALQFRAEALNAFNTPQFNRPNNAFGNPNFGAITNQLNFPRFVQFGARLYF